MKTGAASALSGGASTATARVLATLSLLCATVAARGDLVLTNFAEAKPLKVMAVGDSITDDCSINGAWRSPLQPLLETNDFPFTFVGRQSSAAYGGFTKVRHEGYCGAVIAPPGVFPAHQYSDVNNYLQKIVPDALAIAGNQPDVMLVLIGANDIGRGRNPFQVATNDMAQLLDTILSNAPNAEVGLAKITSLVGGIAGGLNYGTYAANVLIYNSQLQKLVNQRRALGQKVFLADMYSAVDYATMFQSDHVHPNALGLKAIAREWLTRLQTITVRPDRITTVLVNGGASWNYNDSGEDLGANWIQTNYDDSSWSNGVARLGYNDPATATIVRYGPQPAAKFVTTYFRHSFIVSWNAVITNLDLRVARADGVVIYLNGQEIYRANMPVGPIGYTNLASSPMTIFNRQIFYPTNVLADLPAGTNWIAAEVHLSFAAAASMGFDMELIGSGYRLPPPPLSITGVDESSVTLNWPASYAGHYSLYSTTNLDAPGSWTPATATVQTNAGLITATQSLAPGATFFRLQQP